jgi:predicted DNA-binding helix-hairpin-helix protein
VKTQEQVEAQFAAIRAQRIAGVDLDHYDKGYVDGLHTALTWVLDLEVTVEQAIQELRLNAVTDELTTRWSDLADTPPEGGS